MDEDRERLAVDELVTRADAAQHAFEHWPEPRVDALLAELAGAVVAHADMLAATTVSETGMGDVADKARKNRFAALVVLDSLAGRVGRGPLGPDKDGVTTIASPVGVVVGVLPVTNPVATMINKVLICLKARNSLILSPHRDARAVGALALRLMEPVLHRLDAPHDLVQLVSGPPSRRRTELLMQHDGVALILATGGAAMVQAAYRSGNPAIGVGPGNAPAYVAADADVKHAARAIVAGKSFDNGIICGSEQHAVIDDAIADVLLDELQAAGAATLTAREAARLIDTAFDRRTGALLQRHVGRPAQEIAATAGIKRAGPIRLLAVPATTTPLTAATCRERLAPIISLFRVRGPDEGLRVCHRLLAEAGAGHTAAVHSNDAALIARFADALPVSRVLVNSPAGLACIGVGNALTPSLTLGCGTFGGTSTTDNVSYLNVVNIKRVARPLPDGTLARGAGECPT